MYMEGPFYDYAFGFKPYGEKGITQKTGILYWLISAAAFIAAAAVFCFTMQMNGSFYELPALKIRIIVLNLLWIVLTMTGTMLVLCAPKKPADYNDFLPAQYYAKEHVAIRRRKAAKLYSCIFQGMAVVLAGTAVFILMLPQKWTCFLDVSDHGIYDVEPVSVTVRFWPVRDICSLFLFAAGCIALSFTVKGMEYIQNSPVGWKEFRPAMVCEQGVFRRAIWDRYLPMMPVYRCMRVFCAVNAVCCFVPAYVCKIRGVVYWTNDRLFPQYGWRPHLLLAVFWLILALLAARRANTIHRLCSMAAHGEFDVLPCTIGRRRCGGAKRIKSRHIRENWLPWSFEKLYAFDSGEYIGRILVLRPFTAPFRSLPAIDGHPAVLLRFDRHIEMYAYQRISYVPLFQAAALRKFRRELDSGSGIPPKFYRRGL